MTPRHVGIGWVRCHLPTTIEGRPRAPLEAGPGSTTAPIPCELRRPTSEVVCAKDWESVVSPTRRRILEMRDCDQTMCQENAAAHPTGSTRASTMSARERTSDG